MRKVFELVRLAGPSRSTILVEGESGTGKELVARAIHTHSPRSGAPFVTVNSGSMPADLLESNLFGHVKGAFTGAIANKKGLFEAADGGSIFFDEIGTVTMETQAKLLRVIQEKEFMRVGSVETQKVDVRIIAATNVDLKKMVGEGRFRDDLYYRLCVITISIPPLRERREDIPGPVTSASWRTRSSERSYCARAAARSASTCCRRPCCSPIAESFRSACRKTGPPTSSSSRTTSAGSSEPRCDAPAASRNEPPSCSRSSPRRCTK
jgi:transcriptional regulator with GAF, ATPase, and Fis domain